MRTLELVSPHMNGPDVRLAQTTLTHNQYGVYFTDPIDGDFGELTAQASYRAKYWLGYSLGSCKHVYGDLLHAYLTGRKPLTTAMKLRRASRLKVVNDQPLRVKAYNSAIRYIGVKESPPNSNHVQFTEWYGLVGAWCAMFVTFNYVTVGSASFKRGSKYAYVPYVVADARAGANNLTLTTNPQQGDLVCYDWDGDGVADHIGLFEKWTDQKAGTFTAIEGNTAVGNDSNGGEVMRRDRSRSNVQVFIHVGK